MRVSRLFFLIVIVSIPVLLPCQSGKVVIEGAVVVGPNEAISPDPGTIRWSGGHFEGYNGSEWIRLDFDSQDEGDADESNEIQSFYVSFTGDTLFLSNSNYVIVPGISAAQPQPILDGDGNVYSSVIIGSQEWLTENLRTTSYYDGSQIPYFPDSSDWYDAGMLSIPAYCWWNNDISTKSMNGAFYNWFVIDTANNGNKNVCPIGWHIPNDIDWDELRDYLGGDNMAGNLLREGGTSGFEGKLLGFRFQEGSFNIGIGSGHWCTTDESTTFTGATKSWIIFQSFGGFYDWNANKGSGMNIRCLKD